MGGPLHFWGPELPYLLLTHGAGSNRNAPLLVALAGAFADAQVETLRYDLPFRQERPHGPPRPSDAARDRQGLRERIAAIRASNPGTLWVGGHSYGGRQASILASEEPGLIDALLLLSYPLHPPKKPAQLRTAHFPNLHTPALFVHGTRDPFAGSEELRQAIAAIPARTALLEFERGAHDLGRDHTAIAARVLPAFLDLAVGHSRA